MNVFVSLYNNYRELILYGIIGAVSAGLDFCIYTLLLYCNSEFLIANTIGVVCGIFTSFTLNRIYNFKVKDKTKRRFIVFFTIGSFGLLISSCLMFCLVEWFGCNELYSKILTIFIVSLIQYLLNKTITFRKT